MSPKSNIQRLLTIAIPKGRVLKQLLPKLKKAGIRTSILEEDSRLLIREDTKAGVQFLLLKPDDVPTYVEYGAADLGIVGRDVLLERGYDLFVPIDLGIGRCRMMVCGTKGGSIPNDLGRAVRVATKFPNIASRYFSSKGLSVEFIYVQGSVELAPLTGLSDVIVDLVETGRNTQTKWS